MLYYKEWMNLHSPSVSYIKQELKHSLIIYHQHGNTKNLLIYGSIGHLLPFEQGPTNLLSSLRIFQLQAIIFLRLWRQYKIILCNWCHPPESLYHALGQYKRITTIKETADLNGRISSSQDFSKTTLTGMSICSPASSVCPSKQKHCILLK